MINEARDMRMPLSPKKPAIEPSKIPIKLAIDIEINPMINAIRVPWINADKISLPMPSVPSQCRQRTDGTSCLPNGETNPKFKMSCDVGEYGMGARNAKSNFASVQMMLFSSGGNCPNFSITAYSLKTGKYVLPWYVQTIGFSFAKKSAKIATNSMNNTM